jgi:hypothetical protein
MSELYAAKMASKRRLRFLSLSFKRITSYRIEPKQPGSNPFVSGSSAIVRGCQTLA